MFDYDTYSELERGTVPAEEMSIAPQNNFTSILVLRELESHAIFTTDGQSADLASVAVGSGDDRETYSPGLMFMRKQTGSDRRFGKSLQRDLLDVECTMQVNGMCQDCVECILYGSAASDDADQQLSITSRVMYDTAYTLRDATAAIDEKFQNAPGDDYAKTAEATIREPDFFEPGTLFPTVITLRDATPEELAFVLGITVKNKRYGAATSRLGRVKNHILGVYTGSEEGAANLGLTRDVIKKLRDNETTGFDSIQDVITASAHDPQLVGEYLRAAFEERIDANHGGLDVERVPEETVNDLTAAATGDDLANVLQSQREASRKFVEQTEEE
ncbi:type I-D CRISPR-associated protein Cas7/Csc2 [Natronococcus wangiae]|uniref:type I-D CRISPR-associated protein Cas7/Csc2 n=1 Tax=Natronococcus wangiae TaxID=3068275 RepID=UPI00273EDD37|nr:type I-D CRISPR-associated protein Cas7/Csc2 [Natronococcus sp. AD5]